MPVPAILLTTNDTTCIQTAGETTDLLSIDVWTTAFISTSNSFFMNSSEYRPFGIQRTILFTKVRYLDKMQQLNFMDFQLYSEEAVRREEKLISSGICP